MKFSQSLCDFWLKQEPQMAFQCTFWHGKKSYVFPSFQRAETEVGMFDLVLLERIVQFELSKDTIKTRRWAKWSRYTEMSSTLSGCSKQRLTVPCGHPPQQGGHHQAKAGQRPQEESWKWRQVLISGKGEGKKQERNYWEDAGVEDSHAQLPLKND